LASIIALKMPTHRLMLITCCGYFCLGTLSHWFLDFGVHRIFPKK
jgi:hypothetical protein